MGDQQQIETLINEEALLFAMFLRNERRSWNQEPHKWTEARALEIDF